MRRSQQSNRARQGCGNRGVVEIRQQCDQAALANQAAHVTRGCDRIRLGGLGAEPLERATDRNDRSHTAIRGAGCNDAI